MSSAYCAETALRFWTSAAAIRNGAIPDGRQVIVAQHGSKPIPIGTLKHIIQGSGLGADDFR